MGLDVLFSPLWGEDPIIKESNPAYLVLPKPIYTNKKMMRWKLEGRKIFVIDTEGNPQDTKCKYQIDIHPDVYFFWNEDFLNRYNDAPESMKKILVGCPRIDFLTESFHSLFPNRESILKSLNLDPQKFTITIATSTSDTHFNKKRFLFKTKQRTKAFAETNNYEDILAHQFKIRELNHDIIRELAKIQDINLVIKPHPNENVFHWEKLVADLNVHQNVVLMKGTSIHHLLQISNLHVANPACTTHMEATAWGIPSIELFLPESPTLFKTEHLGVSGLVAKDMNEFWQIFWKYKNKETNFHPQPQFQNYVEKFYHKLDGKRCAEYATVILKEIKTPTQKLNSYARCKFQLKIALLELKETLFRIKNQLMQFNKKPSLEKVDHEGRFDNRIKLHDEETWYSLFRKNKLIE